MKKIWLVFIFCFLLESLGQYSYGFKVVDRILVVVNDEVITSKDIESAFIPMKRQYLESYKGDRLHEELLKAKKTLLKHIIEETLIYQDSLKKGFHVKESEVEDSLNLIKSRFPNQESFDLLLSQQNLTLELLRKNIRKQICIKQYKEVFIFPFIQIPDKELRAYYEKNKNRYLLPEEMRVQQIFLPFKDQVQKDKVRQTMKTILNSLKEDLSFEELIRKYSQGPNAANGGDLGFLKKGQMIRPMEQTLSKMIIGEVSPLVESDSGFHIFKLIMKKQERILSFDEVKDKIRQTLFSEKVNDKYKTVIKDLKSKTYIDYREDITA